MNLARHRTSIWDVDVGYYYQNAPPEEVENEDPDKGDGNVKKVAFRDMNMVLKLVSATANIMSMDIVSIKKRTETDVLKKTGRRVGLNGCSCIDCWRAAIYDDKVVQQISERKAYVREQPGPRVEPGLMIWLRDNYLKSFESDLEIRIPFILPSDEEGLTPKVIEARLEEMLYTEDHSLSVRLLLGQLHVAKKEYQQAREVLETCPDYCIPSLYTLGMLHMNGLGTELSKEKGFFYMLAVATKGEVRTKLDEYIQHMAEYVIGALYFNSKEQDLGNAESWWLRAAADGSCLGSVKAQTSLGFLYSDPRLKNMEKAFFWHSEATGNRSIESQGMLGVMFWHGWGTKKDASKAMFCLKAATERGNVFAAGNLVEFYYRSCFYGMSTKIAMALDTLYENPSHFEDRLNETDCLRFFAEKGMALSNFYLGRCYQQGLGNVEKSEEKARKHFQKAKELDVGMTHYLLTLVWQNLL